VAYLFLTFSPFFHLLEWSVTGHTLFAVFLGITFVGMVRLKYLFNQQSYSKKIQLREFQTELETKVVTLTKANEDWVKAYHALEQNVASLHAEMAEQKSATTKLSDANGELVAANQQMSLVNQQLLQTQQQLQQSTAALQEELSQQRMLLDAAAQAAADREAAALASPIGAVRRLCRQSSDRIGRRAGFPHRQTHARTFPENWGVYDPRSARSTVAEFSRPTCPAADRRAIAVREKSGCCQVED
jgi:hypothetical protein